MTGRRGRRALFLSRDPGSVRAMLPVACALARRPGWAVEVAALPATASIVAEATAPVGIAPRPLDAAGLAADPPGVLGDLLDRARPDVVVSGSSPGSGTPPRTPPETPEQHLIAAARHCGIRSVGILDYWGFYAERFAGADGALDPGLLPDRLCVLDTVCRDDLAALGVSADRMAVTHNPALDAMVAEAAGLPQPAAATGRLLFASQPLAENGAARGWPLTQHDLFDILLAALAGDAARRVLVWLHPREDAEAWRPRWRAGGSGPAVVRCDDRSAAVLASVDALVTSHSTASYLAALCDTPVISMRPFAWTREEPIVDRLGLAHRADDAAALGALLAGFDAAAERRRMAGSRARLSARGVFYSDGRATERVLGVVDTLIETREPCR